MSNEKTLKKLENHEHPWVALAYSTFFTGSQNKSERERLVEKTINNPLIKNIIDECMNWPGYTLKRHNDAKHIIQKIGFLADIGLDNKTKEIEIISNKLMENTSENGAFLSEILIPYAFGGNNKAEWNWIICDFPLITEALIRFGLAEDKRVLKSVELIENLASVGGWKCSSYYEKFKGPGKKTDPCPIANLFALKVLGLYKNKLNSKAAESGINMMLDFWKKRKSTKYFLFGMGTKFKKLKYPFVWFDILHVTETLSLFPSIYKDKRFLEFCEIIFSKVNEEGWYKPESIWMAYKGFDFGQKKFSSAMISLAVQRIKKRVGLI